MLYEWGWQQRHKEDLSESELPVSAAWLPWHNRVMKGHKATGQPHPSHEVEGRFFSHQLIIDGPVYYFRALPLSSGVWGSSPSHRGMSMQLFLHLWLFQSLHSRAIPITPAEGDTRSSSLQTRLPLTLCFCPSHSVTLWRPVWLYKPVSHRLLMVKALALKTSLAIT